MTCPKCQAPMRQYERSGITVDQCTECRGIYLDRGELERLVDAENAWHGEPSRQQQQPAGDRPSTGWRDYDSDEYPKYDSRKRKKRRGFLEELFD